jgi:hypothetical protein
MVRLLACLQGFLLALLLRTHATPYLSYFTCFAWGAPAFHLNLARLSYQENRHHGPT